MSEVTRIVTAQITIIEKMPPESADDVVASQKLAEKNVADTLRKIYNADDVLVEIQDFVKNTN